MLVLATFAIIMLLMVAGVAIDLGTAYAGGRQMQNAADAAALAATSELECVMFSPDAAPPGVGCQTLPAKPGAVGVVAQTVANENGAAGPIVCEMEYYNPSGGYSHSSSEECDNPYGTNGWYATSALATTPNAPNYANLAGVYVEVASSQATSFGGITGTTSTAEHRQAAAAIQQIMGSSLGSSFFACASASNSTDDLLTPEPSSASNQPGFLALGSSSALSANGITLDSDMQYNGGDPAGYLINSAALYNSTTQLPTYNIWGPSGTATCGLGSAASKGLVLSLNTPLPNTESIKAGDTAGQIYNPVLVADGCTGTESSAQSGCKLVVPICVGSNGATGSNGVLWCVGFGEFEYLGASTNSPSNSASFGFLGLAPNATAGPGASGPPSPSGINVVRLVQ